VGIFLVLALASVLPTVASAADGSAVTSRGEPEIVIYGDDLALVREPLRLSLAKGVSQIDLENVPQEADGCHVRGGSLRLGQPGGNRLSLLA